MLQGVRQTSRLNSSGQILLWEPGLSCLGTVLKRLAVLCISPWH
jgi:hypothetical protein